MVHGIGGRVRSGAVRSSHSLTIAHGLNGGWAVVCRSPCETSAPPAKERPMKASIFALAALWAGTLLAQPPPPPEHAAHMERLATLLDLTDAQKTQVQAVLQEEHAKIRAAPEQAKAAGTKPDGAQMQAMHG